MAYPEKPIEENMLPSDIVFSENSVQIRMTEAEMREGYNNDGEDETLLTSRPDAHRFNNFWYRVHNTINWVVGYIEELYTDKLSKTGGSMTGYLNMGDNKVKSSATPTQDDDLTNKSYVDKTINAAMWVGEVKALSYPKIPSLPSGVEVVYCDGRAISRTTYSQLFSMIGTAFGSGNGSTTFNIPDYRGLFLRGWSGGSGRDSSRIYGTIQQDSIKKHSHVIPITKTSTGSDPGSTTPLRWNNGDWAWQNVTAPKTQETGDTETRPINSTVCYVIRIK